MPVQQRLLSLGEAMTSKRIGLIDGADIPVRPGVQGNDDYDSDLVALVVSMAISMSNWMSLPIATTTTTTTTTSRSRQNLYAPECVCVLCEGLAHKRRRSLRIRFCPCRLCILSPFAVSLCRVAAGAVHIDVLKGPPCRGRSGCHSIALCVQLPCVRSQFRDTHCKQEENFR